MQSMKHLHRSLTLGLVSVILLAGCAKDADFEALSARVDSLEYDRVKSIETLVSSIRSSVYSLERTDASLQAYIAVLQNQIAGLTPTEGEQENNISELQIAIETLGTKGADLQTQITGLKEYADKLASGSQAWANTTFATLEQYNASAKTISEILETLTAIDGKITATDDTVTAHAELLSSLEASISAMQLDITTLKRQMYSVLSRIQSVNYVPKFSDGKAIVTYTTDCKTITPGSAAFDFRVKPDSIAAEIAALWAADKSILSLTAFHTVSTRTVPDEVELPITGVTAEKGYLRITASGNGLKDDFFKGRLAASACLKLSDGNNDRTAGTYIPLVSQKISIQAIPFADQNFKNYCLQNFDTDYDGELSDFEISHVIRMNCSNLDIANLNGIQYFTEVESLDCSGNSIESLDVTALGKLTSLDVSDNENLTDLTINGIPLSSLKLSKQLDCLVGQYICCEGVQGIIFYAAADCVKIASLIETTTNFDDGITWCRQFGSGWDMPSCADFQTIYRNKSKLNSTLTSISQTIFSDYIYWTDDVVDNAHCSFNMELGSSGRTNKDRSYIIRATRQLEQNSL